MKKIIYFTFFVFVLLVGLFSYSFFFDKEDNSNNKPKISNIKKKEENNNKKDIYVDKNPIKVGLYKNYRNGTPRKLITEWESSWSYHNDISSFEVYYTNEDEIPTTSQKSLFDEYKNKYENINDYKIGYIISFDVGDTKINKTILSPKDTEEFFKYLEIYLYDDYNQSGGWYSHIEEKDINENTILTSIKLTAGENISEITSDIELSTFTYIKEDLDINNKYKGKSIYRIIVKNTQN